jgi:hypothetical protein
MTDPAEGITATLDTAGAEDDLRSLLHWLREDETLDIPGQVGDSAPPTPGSMGGTAFDVLTFAVGSGLSAASLVLSVLQWQLSRRRAPAVTLRRGGIEVVLTAAAARDDATVRRIVEILDAAPAALPTQRTEETGGDDGTA